jgi:DNA-directed RNA polymerase specialized sigma24 family protein
LVLSRRRTGATYQATFPGDLGVSVLRGECAGSDSDAQDIAADALARVWLKWRARAIDDFWPHLRVAVVNEVRSAARRTRVAQRLDRTLPGQLGDPQRSAGGRLMACAFGLRQTR